MFAPYQFMPIKVMLIMLMKMIYILLTNTIVE